MTRYTLDFGLLIVVAVALLPVNANGQPLGSGSLTGNYHFVHLLAAASPAGALTNAYNLSGTIAFDGAGHFTFTGKMGSGEAAPVPVTGSGAYSVAPSGFVTFDNPNPQAEGNKINARLGNGAEVLSGTSTDTRDGLIDFFIALRGAATASNATWNGSYTGGVLGFLNGSAAFATTALFDITSTGTGAIPSASVFGHAADVAGDLNFSEMTSAVSYSIRPDGTGIADFGEGFGIGSGLFFGDHDIFVSADGSLLIGSSNEKFGRQIFVAVRRLPDGTPDPLSGDYWVADMSMEQATGDLVFRASTGAARPLAFDGQKTLSTAQRVYRVSNATESSGASTDASGTVVFRVGANSRGTLGPPLNENHINMAVGANAFVGAQVDVLGERATRHGIFFGTRAPSFSGAGVFLNPLGVVNGASFAMPTYPISPGTIVALFGTNLAPAGTDIPPPPAPLPFSLGGVSVTVNGTPAPIFSVRPDQINIQVPFATQGPKAAIVVNNNGTLSNSAEVDVAATSPGVFTIPAGGIGPGAITHLDFQRVTKQNPARPGEIVSIFLTGLGRTTPPVSDGVASPAAPLAEAIDPPNIRVRFGGNLSGEILYAGLAPGFVGLYQINVRIPDDPVLVGLTDLRVETSNAVTDFVDLEIAF